MNRETNPLLAQGRCEVVDVDGQPVRIRREGAGPLSPESRQALEGLVRAARALVADSPADGDAQEARLRAIRGRVLGRVRRG